MSHENSDPCYRYYARQISQYPLLTPEQEVSLAAKIRNGDKAAKDQMINANLRLVVKIAGDYANLGLPLMDLISEGNIGLIKAVERFDPDKGGRLSTYGVWWIRHSIKRALGNQGKTIRLPIHLVDRIAKLYRVGELLSSELGREASDEEIAEEMGIDAAKIGLLKQAAIRPASLDAPVGDEDHTAYGDLIRDTSAIDPSENLSEKSSKMELDELISRLDDREKKIISARFGLNGHEPITLKEVGEKLGVTRERIRQLEKTALSKMRSGFALREKVRPFDGRKFPKKASA